MLHNRGSNPLVAMYILSIANFYFDKLYSTHASAFTITLVSIKHFSVQFSSVHC